MERMRENRSSSEGAMERESIIIGGEGHPFASDRTYMRSLSAASKQGLCPHMQNPRLGRGVPFCIKKTPG